jgi:hypothetical protein
MKSDLNQYDPQSSFQIQQQPWNNGIHKFLQQSCIHIRKYI